MIAHETVWLSWFLIVERVMWNVFVWILFFNWFSSMTVINRLIYLLREVSVWNQWWIGGLNVSIWRHFTNWSYVTQDFSLFGFLFKWWEITLYPSINFLNHVSLTICKMMLKNNFAFTSRSISDPNVIKRFIRTRIVVRKSATSATWISLHSVYTRWIVASIYHASISCASLMKIRPSL